MARPPPSPELAAMVGLGRQLGREWRAGPLHSLLIAGPKPAGLATRPRDLRPADPAAGERLLRGEFRLRGAVMDAGVGGDPWDRPCPGEGFAQALHGFGWIADLIAAGEAGAREALRLWLGWRRLFGRPADFGWSGEALERRVFHLACAAPALLPLASDAEGAALLGDLARQARHLLTDAGGGDRGLERATAAALAGAALAGPPGERLLGRALPRLERLAPLAVLPDGVHATRSPERGLELLFDLLALDDALSQRGAPAPVEVSRAIDRLSSAVRFFTLADRRLPRFHGGGEGAPESIAAALALDAARTGPAKSAAYGGYERLEGRQLQVIADTGAPPAGAWSVAACAQPAAIEVACAGRPLIVASAWSADPAADPAMRGPAGGSCLALGGRWPGLPLEGLPGRVFGPRLDAGEPEVKAARRESGDGVWLDIVHGGWRDAGQAYARRLFLDLVADELRGEDQLTPFGPSRGRSAIRYSVRFLLAPQVSASIAQDGRSALIRPPDGSGWRLRGDAAEMYLEPSQVLEDGQPRQTQAVVLAGVFAPAAGGRVRWKLSHGEG